MELDVARRAAEPERPTADAAPAPQPPHARVLELQRSVGNATVTRLLARQAAPVAEPPAAGEAPGAAVSSLTFDALLEQMAHGMTYELGPLTPDQMALLSHFGYSDGGLLMGTEGMQTRSFLASDPQYPQSVVAFRGTEVDRGIAELVLDVGADTDAAGIGLEQFMNNVGTIERRMREAARRGPVIVTGHSLGGALAQIGAAMYPDLVARVVTFQAPGINRDMVRRLEAYNRGAQARGGAGVASTHYRASGDLVPLGGQGFTPGEIRTFDIPGGADPSSHMAFPVTAAAGAQGLPLPFGPMMPGYTAFESSRTTTEEENEEFRASDAARIGLGVWGGMARRGGGLGGALGYLQDQRGQAEYMRAWGEISAAMDRGAQPTEIFAMIEGYDLDDARRARLTAQFREAWLGRHPRGMPQ